MAAEKYFIFDRELWDIGFSHGCEADGNSVLAMPEKLGASHLASKACYFSGPIDSGAKETVWHKFLLDFKKAEDSALYLSYFASDEQYFVYEGEQVLIEEIIKSEELSAAQKLQALDSAWVERVINPDNVLLSKAKGRYLWFALEIVMYGAGITKITGLKIEFPYHSITSMLPSVYTKDQEPHGFFNRFMCVFQSFFEEMRQDVNNISRCFDSDAVNYEFLCWLASWLGIENNGIWSEHRLRRLIKSIYGMYRKKGTLEGLSEIIGFYTGEPPLIIENHELLSYYDNKEYGEAYKSLYGDNRYAFYIFVNQSRIKNIEVLKNIKRLAEAFSPVYTEPYVVPLSNCSGIGQHTYLGINSQIVEASGLVLDEFLSLNNNIRL